LDSVRMVTRELIKAVVQKYAFRTSVVNNFVKLDYLELWLKT
jgi:hypothetical protein